MDSKTYQCKDCKTRQKGGFCEATKVFVARRKSAKGCEHFKTK